MLARLAAKAPVADDEFLQLAELIETRVWKEALSLAELAAQARTEDELQEIMKKADTLKQ